MNAPLSDLGVTLPLLAAPMAGGVSTPELVVAAAHAGAVGFLAGGYQAPAALAAQIGAVRAAGVPFGVNLFVPNPLPIEAGAFRRYARAIQPEADRYGLDLADAELVEDDDKWSEKLELLLSDPVALVSFTFGIPSPRIIAALRQAGSVVVQTVTSAAEATAATESGVDMLAVQGHVAGGHSGTLTPREPPAEVALEDLLNQIGAATPLPLIAAGGIATPDDVAGVIAAGACAAALGTALLLAEESGTSAVHRAALTDPKRRETVLTRAFTGRPARGLRNDFTDRYSAEAPVGYPAVHHLTSPLRQAATAAEDPELVHLWAGVGYRHSRSAAAAEILTRLAEAV